MQATLCDVDSIVGNEFSPLPNLFFHGFKFLCLVTRNDFGGGEVVSFPEFRYAMFALVIDRLSGDISWLVVLPR